MKRIFYFLTIIMIVACADDDSFSTSSSLRLSFSKDTISLDTLFSRTPSATYTFWVRNNNDDGLRIADIHLKRRNQTGFRVNVDGSYLDNSLGSQVNDIEIRRNDSILVFVELTTSETLQLEPTLIEDDLIFTLESGQQQMVNLRAWSWDAEKLYNPVIEGDQLIESPIPIIIYGDLTIAEGACLTLRNTTLFFHEKSGIEVLGSLSVENCLFRGDRLDRMFSNLPYDRVSGQWNGVHFHEKASGIMNNTEIRNANDAVVLDSADLDTTQVRLAMSNCIVHNCKGYGLRAVNSYVSLMDCQFTNTLYDCVSVVGGVTDIIHCTMAQFYPFTAERGVALSFTNFSGTSAIPLHRLSCSESIITGYDKDVLFGGMRDSVTAFEFWFNNSLIRTQQVTTSDSVRFKDIIWETPNDSIQGKKHFLTIDEENLYYDFHLDPLSTAKGLGCYY